MALTRLQKYSAVAVSNLRHNLMPHLLLSVGFLLLTPVIFGVNDLDARAAAVPLEYFVSLTGAVLLTPIFLPEQDEAVRDVVMARETGLTPIYLLRAATAVLALLCISLSAVLMLWAGDCQVDLTFLSAVFANGIFLGGLGAFACSLCGNIAVGYMIPVLYYVLNFAGKPQQFGPFYLFSLSQGQTEGKWLLLFSGCMLLAAAIGLRHMRQKLQ